jgi:hypothetical protein
VAGLGDGAGAGQTGSTEAEEPAAA